MRAAWLAAAILLLPLAQAAEQPRDVPTDFRNGQDTAFGSIAMDPYVEAGKGPVPVEAHVTLRDLDVLSRAETVLLELNLHSDEADLVVDGAFDAAGEPIAPLRTADGEDGLQAQLFVSARDVASRASDGDGAVALTFRGHATPRSNGQIHVGVLVAAYAADWSMVQAPDGPAQLYGYSLVQSTAAGGGLMPFHGQGNTLLVLPFVALSFLVLLAGGMATEVLRTTPTPAPMPAPGPAPAARPNVPVFGSSIPVFGAPVPVFGSPVSPVLRKPPPMGPIQGPALPPHWGRPAAKPPPPPAPAAIAAPTPAPAPVPPPTPAPAPTPRRTHVAVRRPKRPASKPRPAAAAPATRAAARAKRQPSR